MEAHEEEDPNETVEDIAKQQEVICSRVGDSYSFYIKAGDLAKHRAHRGRPGCRCVLEEVATQRGHNKECKFRAMTAMEADKDDKHRARRWYLAKGMDEESRLEEQA